MGFDIGGYKYNITMVNSQLNKKLGTVPELPASNAAAIMSANPGVADGYYYIKFGTFGVKRVYCIMNTAVNGGGWMGVTSDMCPQTLTSNTSASWETNSSKRLQGDNSQILNASVVETGCGGGFTTSTYKLKNPNDYGYSFTNTMMLMQRVSTIGQCSAIIGGTDSGYYSGPVYNGSYTSSGMCTWGDYNFANDCCGAQNMSGLKTWWVLFGSGTNPDLQYKVECAGGSGQHYHMWFIK
jgi:hypothetical protein